VEAPEIAAKASLWSALASIGRLYRVVARGGFAAPLAFVGGTAGSPHEPPSLTLVPQ